MFQKLKVNAKRYSPEILTSVGVFGVVTGVVLACLATRKADDILDEHNDKIELLKERGDATKKEIVATYVKTGAKLAKAYAPATMIITASLTSMVTSNRILKKRNLQLAAAYTALNSDFKLYRSRVIERYGKEVDYELRTGVKKEEIEEVEIGKDGKEKKVKKTVEVHDPNGSIYIQYFTKDNPYWPQYAGDETYLQLFFNRVQSTMNDILKTREEHFVTLNEVLYELGFERNDDFGMVVGWIYDPDEPNGDNFIQLDVRRVKVRNKKTGEIEDAYAIDFNVDGLIHKKVKEKIKCNYEPV